MIINDLKKIGIGLFSMACLLACGIASTPSQAQVVGLDNWFNKETHAKTGLPFHYLWNDSADSGYSRWGEIFIKQGATLVTLHQPDVKTLKPVDIYIIVDPDSTSENPVPNYILPDDIRTIKGWVKKGGVLILLANDWKHCGLTHLNKLSKRFGMTFNQGMLHPVVNNQYEMGAFTRLPDHPVFAGVNKIFLKEVASIHLSGNARAVLEENDQVIMAECNYGKGFVFAVGDPWIYNEYIGHDRLPADFENRKAAENLTGYLLQQVKH
jgi:unsaturated rhamnogalacturonyl hydrolase